MNNSEEETEAASGESSTNHDAEDEESRTLVNGNDSKHRIFYFHMVNSYGSAEVDGIHDDGRPIKFSSEYAIM